MANDQPISGKIVTNDGDEIPVSATIHRVAPANGLESWTASVELPPGVYPPAGVLFQLVVEDGRTRSGFFKQTKFAGDQGTTATFRGHGPWA